MMAITTSSSISVKPRANQRRHPSISLGMSHLNRRKKTKKEQVCSPGRDVTLLSLI
jgi:hypothetical protein